METDEEEFNFEKVIFLYHECKYLASKKAYDTLLHIINTSDNAEISIKFKQDLLKHENTINIMLERFNEIMELISYEDVCTDWILGITYFGITTHYKKCDDNTILIKIDGVLENLPIFEQLAVIHEVDLFTEWMPFCMESKLVKKVGRAELYPYLNVGLPPVTRDFLLKAYGADCLKETGKIAIIARSIDELEGSELPLKTTGWFHERMIVKEMKFVVDILSPTSAKTSVIAHLDLKMHLPQAMINFLIKNLAGIILYKFQCQVIKVQKNSNSDHAKRIRQDVEFYRDWLLPKIKEYCWFKEWEQPIVTSLDDV
jgi:hypothetical protein